ncbi:ABC-2 transporter permease [Clostridium minihomine]|uniref:ABC-2 transporter permease n=1 Tax=Clostridium minihomine TaxID=2045012 RepID=UPI000C79552E|nr:ABC-2 transporter permease [Clostridium minihomine]
MILQLVKKDFLIAKKMIFIILAIVCIIPPFFLWTAPELAQWGIIPFLYMVILGELIIFQMLFQLEGKNPKAEALLCAAPYPRSAFAAEKYVLFLLIFAYCYFVHTIEMVLFNPAGLLDLLDVLAVLFLAVIIFCIYLPLEFKYGIIKIRFFYMTIVIVLSIGPSVFAKIFANSTVNLAAFASIPSFALGLVLAVASILIFGISLAISIGIYEKKEL